MGRSRQEVRLIDIKRKCGFDFYFLLEIKMLAGRVKEKYYVLSQMGFFFGNEDIRKDFFSYLS